MPVQVSKYFLTQILGEGVWMEAVLMVSKDHTGGGETFACGFHDERWWEMCSGLHQ